MDVAVTLFLIAFCLLVYGLLNVQQTWMGDKKKPAAEVEQVPLDVSVTRAFQSLWSDDVIRL